MPAESWNGVVQVALQIPPNALLEDQSRCGDSPVEGLRKGNRLSCLGQDQRADRADVPCCRDVHGGVEAFHSSTERPNVGRGCPVLSYVCLISLVIVPRYARSCPATALSSEEMPVNSRKSCCLPSNLKEGDFFQHDVAQHEFSPHFAERVSELPEFLPYLLP